MWTFSLDGRAQNSQFVYHYTTIEGLFGIIQRSKLFATDMFYLNDAKEVSYPLALITQVLDRCDEVYTEQHHASMITRLREGVSSSQEMLDWDPKFVSCFCVDGDLLS